ncbi:T9SS type A sorting domain-containing protein [Saccharicrinis sp. FJH54]|uniref:T9SS type A sorting domain-containing protein n=1 Tax=Saccharicrinis sp. FJH54 TaxID=3344665 RepID=UPI0035D4C06E
MRTQSFFLILFFSTSLVFSQITWNKTKIADGSNLQKMVVVDENTAVIVGLNSAIKQTTDRGQSWHDVNLPDTIGKFDPEAVDYYDLAIYGDTILTCLKRIKLTDDAKPEDYVNSLLLISYDKGSNWNIFDYTAISDGSQNPVTDAFADSSYSIDIINVAMDSKKNIYTYANWVETNGTEQNKHSAFFTSSDFGESWENIFNTDFEGLSIKSIFFKDTLGFLGGNKALYTTLDGNWVDITPGLITANDNDANFYVYNVVEAENDHYLIATTSDGIFDYSPEDHSFSKLSMLGCNDLFYLGHQNILAVGSASKTALTTDWGENWEPYSPGETLFDAGGILGDSIYALASDFVFTMNISDMNLPDSYHHAVYNSDINVFRTGYNIFTVNSKVQAKYDVYNLSGKVLVSDFIYSGSTTVDLNALSRGIYIFRTTGIDNRISVHKLIIQ